MKNYTLIDLFAGAGGITTGFHWAGFDTVFANEYDPSIALSFTKNYPETRMIVGDIRNVDFHKIKKELHLKDEDIDVIAGGPPCQGFSMANRKRVEKDKRNLLFLEFVRAVAVFKPKCFLIENVMGMKSESVEIANKNINVDDSISSYFEELGYQISFKSFKAEEHGVPQIRRRVMIVGTRIKSKFDALANGKIGNLKKQYQTKSEFLSPEKKDSASTRANSSKIPPPITVWEALSDLPKLHAGEGNEEANYATQPQNDFQKWMRKDQEIVYNHFSTPHSVKVLERMSHIKQGENFKQLPDDLKTKSVHSGAYGRLESEGLSPTITTRFDTPSTGRVIHPFQDRTITVREAARLQSFPDHYIFYGTRTSQGKQVGNAVPPLVAKAIAEMFINDFLKTETDATYRDTRESASNTEMSPVCN